MIAFASMLLIMMHTSCTDDYSDGTRIGVLKKFSKKGLIYKTWEGEMYMSPSITSGSQYQGVGGYDTFYFSIDEEVHECQTPIDSIVKYMNSGEAVIVTYKQIAFTDWNNSRGNSDYKAIKIEPFKK